MLLLSLKVHDHRADHAVEVPHLAVVAAAVDPPEAEAVCIFTINSILLQLKSKF